MIPSRGLVLSAALLLAASGAASEALWAEAEHWAAQRGSVGPDRPPFGSRGACLGSSWGGAKGHYAVYRFRLGEPMPDARLLLRHARKDPGDSLFSLTLDGRVVAAKAALKSTGGWGHLRDDEWAYRAFRLGPSPQAATS